MRDEAPNRDLWITPPWVTQLLGQVCSLPKCIIEPSAGKGHIAAELVRLGKTVLGIERDGGLEEECRTRVEKGREQCPSRLETVGTAFDFIEADFLSIRRPEIQAAFRTMRSIGPDFGFVLNPPYSPAKRMLEHVEHAIALSKELCNWRSFTAALLPLAFSGSAARRDFWERNKPSHVFPLVERPSFATGRDDGPGGSRDVCWFIWDSGERGQIWRPISREELLPWNM